MYLIPCVYRKKTYVGYVMENYQMTRCHQIECILLEISRQIKCQKNDLIYSFAIFLPPSFNGPPLPKPLVPCRAVRLASISFCLIVRFSSRFFRVSSFSEETKSIKYHGF